MQRQTSVGLSPPCVPGLAPVMLSPRAEGEKGGVVSARSSALLEEKGRLLAAAKQVEEEIRQSEAQAREQQAVADIISNELREKAKTPRATRSSPPVSPRGTQPQLQTPVQQSAGQQPVIQRAVPPQVQLDEVQMNVAQSQNRAPSPVRVQVIGSTITAADVSAQTVLGQQVRSLHAAVGCSDGADNNRQPRSVSAAGVSTWTRESSGLTIDGSDDEDDEGWAQFGAGSTETEAAQRDVGMQSLLETESQVLLIMQFSENGTSVMRTDLTRTHLLEICRNDIDPHRTQRARTLSKSTSFGQIAELNREQPPAEHHESSVSDLHSAAANSLANLHLRDLRYLQGVNDHHLMPRRGALVVSLGLMNVVITHRNAFFVVPDGADKLLQVCRLSEFPVYFEYTLL